MVNVRCQACRVKYRILAEKKINLMGVVLEQPRPKATELDLLFNRFPYGLPIHRKSSNDSQKRLLLKPTKDIHSSAANKLKLRRQAKVTNSDTSVPRFHYPLGRPSSETQLDNSLDYNSAIIKQLSDYDYVAYEDFAIIIKGCGLPLYWKKPFFLACGGGKFGGVSMETVLEFCNKMKTKCHDEESRFLFVLTSAGMAPNLNRPTSDSSVLPRNFLVPEDFAALVQDVVDTHPGLSFLKEAKDFHSRYIQTVIARIFYDVNRSWSGRITLTELRRSTLLSTIHLLEDAQDINQIISYFSYEHFYVIYCKFWELDSDHDLLITKSDLAHHNNYAISPKVIDRIFSPSVSRGLRRVGQGQVNVSQTVEFISYTDFVWFLVSEEDKKHPTSIEYWFRCMDLDGDGFLSYYELEHFYEEQMYRLRTLGIEPLTFDDCLCQMLDMIRPSVPNRITLTDLKRCPLTPVFFDTFFNVEKYLLNEQRNPFNGQRDSDHNEMISDWDRYAAEEYDFLVEEEGEETMFDDPS